MIGIAILILASGTVAWKMHGAIQKKKFQANAARVQVQLEACYRLALNTNADWQVSMELKGDRLVVRGICTDGSSMVPFQPRAFPIDPLDLVFNGENKDSLTFYFSARGHVAPQGTLVLTQNEFHHEISIPELFHREDDGKNPPLHPEDG